MDVHFSQNLLMKRNECPDIKPVVTQTCMPRNEKSQKRTYPENSEKELSCFIKTEENPQQSIITTTDDSPLLVETKKWIGKFFYESGLDLDAVDSPTFRIMISLCSAQMKQLFPTPQELKGWIFQDAVKEMRSYVNEMRDSWAETGCSILLDGWTDGIGRDLVNVSVDSPKGTVYLRSFDISDSLGNMDAMELFLERVVIEVGINNVVQIIMHSNSVLRMKGIEERLMKKYRHVFLTVSASHCIELILENLERMNHIKKTLDRAKIITRFIYNRPDALQYLRDYIDSGDLIKPSRIRSMQSFLTLENIVLQKDFLKKMFFPSSLFASTEEGRRVSTVVADRDFWGGALTVLNAALPLMRIVEWMNENKSEQMGCIYETIDQAKETIKKLFKNKNTQYTQYWEAIDEVWSGVFHSPLHSAGYYLNPIFFYSSNVYIDSEVAAGLCCCIVRMNEDRCDQDRIIIQMEHYKAKMGDFSVGSSVDRRENASPAAWWSKYGRECPELQRMAIRVLSQTCDGASKFQLKRGLAEKLLSKGLGNQIEQKRLTDKVFLQYNMELKNFSSREIDHVKPEEIDPSDDWIVNKGAEEKKRRITK